MSWLSGNLSRGFQNLSGQLSTMTKDILTEVANEEHSDPMTELKIARNQIQELELKQQAFQDECISLKKRCDELTMQKQAVDIKADMLLAESRRTIEEKDNELRRLRADQQQTFVSNSNNENTWTDLLEEDDQPKISEFIKYERIIKELKDENVHLRNETANLRKTLKSNQFAKDSRRREEDVIAVEQVYAEQIATCREQYEQTIAKLKKRIQELEDWNDQAESVEFRKNLEVQKDVDDVDKELLSQELEQANEKLSWYSDQLKQQQTPQFDLNELQINYDSLKNDHDQLNIKLIQMNDELQRSQIKIRNYEIQLQRIDEYEETITTLQQELDDTRQKYAKKQQRKTQDKQQQTEIDNKEQEDQADLLSEERERCEQLSSDYEGICRLLEETRSELNERNEALEYMNKLSRQNEDYEKKYSDLLQLKNNLQERSTSPFMSDHLDNTEEMILREKQLIENLNSVQDDKNMLELTIESLNEQIKMLKEEAQQPRETILVKHEENDDQLKFELGLREMLERQLIQSNEDIQSLQNENEQQQSSLSDLQELVREKDKQIQNFEQQIQTLNSTIPPPSPTNRARSPSPQTFERLLDFEAQTLANEEKLKQFQLVYDQIVEQLPSEFSDIIFDHHDELSSSLADKFLNLFEKWFTYVQQQMDTMSITHQELENLKQILSEKNDDLEKLQFDLDLREKKLFGLQQQHPLFPPSHDNELDTLTLDHIEDDDELRAEQELRKILEQQQHRQSVPLALRSQSVTSSTYVSSTPGEKQQLIAQNELLTSILSEKDRELIQYQQQEKLNIENLKQIEVLQKQLKQYDLERELKQIELHDIRNIFDEKLRENSSLKKEKLYFIERLTELEREKQEQPLTVLPLQGTSPNAEGTNQNDQNEDMTKEALQAMAKLVCEREQEIQQLKQQTPRIEQHDQQNEYMQLKSEYDQLIEFSKRQHEESLLYYSEYNRFVQLYNDVNTKYSQLQVDYQQVQSLLTQKQEAYLLTQNELTSYQNLLYHEKKNTEDYEQLKKIVQEKNIYIQTLIEQEQRLQLKLNEYETELKLFEQMNFDMKTNESVLYEKIDQLTHQNNLDLLQTECKRLTYERDQAMIEMKKYQLEIEQLRYTLNQYDEREKRYAQENERLRSHLLTIEESYTIEGVQSEEREQTLRTQMLTLDEQVKQQTEIINQLNSTCESSKQTLANELGKLKYEYSKLEAQNTTLNNQLIYQTKCTNNLQTVLEQFQRDRDQYINENLKRYHDALREQTTIATTLTKENSEIRSKLAEYDEALGAAKRLTEQMEKKDQLISALRQEIQNKEILLKQFEQQLKDINISNVTRVEKHLVKNILLSYFHTPPNKRQEVIPLLGALVGFTQDEYQKAVEQTMHGQMSSGANGWLGGWFSGGSEANTARTRTQSATPSYDPNKSFTELLIQYVDQQSGTDSIRAKFNTEDYMSMHSNKTNASNGGGLLSKPPLSATNPFLNSTPHLKQLTPDNNGSLSTNHQQIFSPVIISSSTTTTNSHLPSESSSSTILKDLLKS
ncbi:unnamed protein product [Didymodactylos carnosus]|uniref:GRIP domain-containing protein n=1 Tax=Didymodactylos carnosus TaxID=1234261 RepID=A0A814AVH2_9BILA|nr:unnamed protein product [Didymodactylos carnosus]CAF0925068.1 unnamed protein product [Didymodactylos carnosus]CAF3699121.1 unnamed protein product [Didymodactylos carnosus]CAF3702182.1 unnamed protein product [Didymodactylos carnosus]